MFLKREKINNNISNALTKYSSSNILLFIIVVLLMIAIQHTMMVGPTPYNDMSILESSFLLCGIILLSFFYFINEYRRKSLFINKPISLILVLLLLCGIIGTFLSPSSINIVVPDVGIISSSIITIDDRILNLLVLVESLYFAYIVLAIFPQKIHSMKQLVILFFVISLVSIIAMFYSFFSDAFYYKEILSGNYVARNMIKSFTDNTNNYAAFLFFGILGLIFLDNIYHKKWLYIVIAILFIASLFTASRTYLIGDILLLIGYFIYLIVVTFKNKKKRNIILLSIVGGLIVIFFATYLIFKGLNIVDKFPPFIIIDSIISRIGSGDNGRDVIWNQCINLFNQTSSWAEGNGFVIFSKYLVYSQSFLPEMGAATPHNGILQIIGNGGLILLFFIVVVFVYTTYAAFKIIKTNKNYFWLYIILFLITCIQMISESPSPFGIGLPIYNYCLLSIIVFVPVLSIYYHKCHHSINHEIVHEVIPVEKKHNKKDLIFSLISIASGLGSIVFTGTCAMYKDVIVIKVFTILMIAISITLPFIFLYVKSKNDLFDFYIKKYCLNFVIPSLISLLIIYLISLFTEISVLLFLMEIILLPFVYLVYICLFSYMQKTDNVIRFYIDLLNSNCKKLLNNSLFIDDNEDEYTLLEKICSKIPRFKKKS